MSNTITLKRGDTQELRYHLKDADGNGIDITGWEFFFTVRKAHNLNNITDEDDDTNALIAKNWDTHSDSANGDTEIELSPTDTNIRPGTYAYDVQVVASEAKVTIVKGDFIVEADVTRS